MHPSYTILAALSMLVPLISAKTMQYGVMNENNADLVPQKIAWISDTDVCNDAVVNLAEHQENACDIPFFFPNRAPGFDFVFRNCNANGVPEMMEITDSPDHSPTAQVQPNHANLDEANIVCNTWKFTAGAVFQQFDLPF
jgi:hypothetical protein